MRKTLPSHIPTLTGTDSRRLRYGKRLLTGLAFFAVFALLSLAFRHLLPLIFPQLPQSSEDALRRAGELGWGRSLFSACAAALGLPYLALFSFVGALLERLVSTHFRLLEGLSYPSLNAKVLSALGQGGPFLIGAACEYVLFLSRSFRRLKKTPPAEEAEDELLND